MINFDQAATSFPKPKNVIDTFTDITINFGVNSNRGFNNQSIYIAEEIYLTRKKLSDFFDGYGAENVVFTPNVTYAINLVLRGFLKKGDHVLISSIEHNAVARAISGLKNNQITFDIIPADKYAKMDINSIYNLVKSNTKAIIVTWGSNIIPILNPVEEIGQITGELGLKFIVDAAQGSGILKLSMKENNIDVLCFTGHKSLYGLQGSGGFLVTEEMANLISPIICGGTGSISEEINMPAIMPDKFEAGTLNAPAIIALKKAIEFIENEGIKKIYEHEIELTKYFIDKIKEIKQLKIVGVQEEIKLPVVLIQTTDMDESSFAYELAKNGVATRVGLHCAPLAHKVIGTYPRGGVRFSFGYFNTKKEIDECIKVIERIVTKN